MKVMLRIWAAVLFVVAGAVAPAVAQDDREFPGKVAVLSSDNAALVVTGGATVGGPVTIATYTVIDGSAITVSGGNGIALPHASGYVAWGAVPATTGAARFTNNTSLYWRNAANSGNVQAFTVDGSNRIKVGGSGNSTIFLDGGGGANIVAQNFGLFAFEGVTSSYPALGRSNATMQVLLADGSDYTGLLTGYLSTGLAGAGIPATGGSVRLPNNSAIMARNAGNSANVAIASVNASNQIQVGDSGFGTYHIVGTGVGIGVAPETNKQIRQGGSFTSTDGSAYAYMMEPTLTVAAANGSLSGLFVGPTFTEYSSGTHALLASVRVSAATVTSGAATVTDTASLYVAGQMTATVSGANYALWVDDGVARFDGTVTAPIFTGPSGNLTLTSDANSNLIVNAAGSGTLALRSNNADRWLIPTSGALTPGANNAYTVGTSALRAANVYSVLGNFSGQVDAGVLAGGAGSVSAPSLTTSGDLNSGLYSVSSGVMGWTADGTERLRLGDSLLIRETTALAWGSSGFASPDTQAVRSAVGTIHVQGASGADTGTLRASAVAAGTGGTAFTVNASGVVKISNTVGAAVAVASTHKVTIDIGGTTYYLLATNVP